VIALDVKGCLGKNLGDRVIQLGQGLQADRFTTGNRQNLGREFGGVRVGLAGQKGDLEVNLLTREFDQGRINPIDGSATH
jgi:hypothetical protein